MATKTFTSMVEFQDMMNKGITIAVETTCNRLLGTLQQLIDSEYYDIFEPNKYKRSYQFYRSAISRMLNKSAGEILMDADSMNYGEYWDGETQLYMADQGFHGSVDDFADGHFWKAFIEFCDKNAMKILREELANQGIVTV